MMAKAFQNNHQKRGLAEMMAPPPTPTAQQQSSYLDCQSLQSSLKRVRLSSSPGELRLQRDLRQMQSSGAWVPKQQQQQQQQQHQGGATAKCAMTSGQTWVWHPPAPPVTVRAQSVGQQPHIELQQVESLRLKLTFQHSVVAWIQIPRMYPHRAPLISRVVYDSHYNNHPTKQTIQSILVHEAPPMRNDLLEEEEGPASSSPQSQGSNGTLHCANTVVYNEWSPVQRLGDLLEFVICVFQRQHEEQLRMSDSNHNDVSLTYSSSSLSSNSSWNNSRRSSNSSLASSSTAASNNTGYRTSSSSLMFQGWSGEQMQQPQQQRQQQYCHQQAAHMEMTEEQQANMASFLTPNRFDKGYNTAAMSAMTTMDVDATTNKNSSSSNSGNHQQQQSMMMDM